MTCQESNLNILRYHYATSLVTNAKNKSLSDNKLNRLAKIIKCSRANTQKSALGIINQFHDGKAHTEIDILLPIRLLSSAIF